MDKAAIKQAIRQGKTALGIELGSSRIKSVLVGPDFQPIASGSHDWENRLENGFWTYSLEDVWPGIQDAYQKVAQDVHARFDSVLKTVGSMGVSGMMHGYLPFDAAGKQLTAFRTWRNTTTEQAATLLTEAFAFNVPQRWSAAHLYQAILNGEPYLEAIDFITTLAGYVHWKLTGEKVLGVGEASGMFPIDSGTGGYDAGMAQRFGRLAAEKGFARNITALLPRVLPAGEAAGSLTQEGARLLDPSGSLLPGIPLCPPEGDAGTGMVATNSVAPRTGNVSAGTSIFAMVVLERPLSKVHIELDMVTTPDGKPVAMVHCNNCTSDLDAWTKLFGELLVTFGAEPQKHQLYDALYLKALEGEADGGGLLSYNYYSGEPITGLDGGRPLLARLPNSLLSLGNFMRSTLYATLATLKIGMDILTEQEHVALDELLGHGGLFKTKGVGQRLMAAALGNH